MTSESISEPLKLSARVRDRCTGRQLPLWSEPQNWMRLRRVREAQMPLKGTAQTDSDVRRNVLWQIHRRVISQRVSGATQLKHLGDLRRLVYFSRPPFVTYASSCGLFLLRRVQLQSTWEHQRTERHTSPGTNSRGVHLVLSVWLLRFSGTMETPDLPIEICHSERLLAHGWSKCAIGLLRL
jgi:hypothetical protein